VSRAGYEGSANEFANFGLSDRDVLEIGGIGGTAEGLYKMKIKKGMKKAIHSFLLDTHEIGLEALLVFLDLKILLNKGMIYSA